MFIKAFGWFASEGSGLILSTSKTVRLEKDLVNTKNDYYYLNK